MGVLTFLFSCSRSNRLRSRRPDRLSRLAMDRIPHRHPSGFHPRDRGHCHRRKLSAEIARVQSPQIATRYRQLGFARQIRRMGCEHLRARAQILAQTHPAAHHANLLSNGPLRQFLLRHLVYATRRDPHHLW